MPDVNALAVSVATAAAFVASEAYYAVLGRQLAAASDAAAADEPPRPWKLMVEVLRCLVVATVVAGLASQGDVDEQAGGLLLGLALWIGFPAVLWTGALIHENTPRRVAVIHAGDWLLKLLIVAAIAAGWT
jgi:Protein of unknown function (DUF1761)